MAPDPRDHPSDPSEFAPEEEPSTPGTLFLCTILLMIVAGFWVIIYLRLLHR
jgi:hypothetical protein